MVSIVGGWCPASAGGARRERVVPTVGGGVRQLTARTTTSEGVDAEMIGSRAVMMAAIAEGIGILALVGA